MQALCCALLSPLLAAWPLRAEENPSPGALASAYLLRLINEARTSPAAMLQRAGIDLEAARAAMGDDAVILDTGLPPLAPDEGLTASAQAHLQDMAARLYYDTLSPEGLGPWDRAAAFGYVPLVLEEKLGLLGVLTFLDWPEAVWVVFRQWLLDDVFATGPEARRVLTPWAVHAGAAFEPVRVELDGETVNAYVAVFDQARPQTFSPMIVGSIRPPGAFGPFVDPWHAPAAPWIVRCRAVDGTLWWESITDPLGGYQCPAVEDWGPMVVDVLQADDGNLLASQPTAAGQAHTWLDIFLP